MPGFDIWNMFSFISRMSSWICLMLSCIPFSACLIFFCVEAESARLLFNSSYIIANVGCAEFVSLVGSFDTTDRRSWVNEDWFVAGAWGASSNFSKLKNVCDGLPRSDGNVSRSTPLRFWKGDHTGTCRVMVKHLNEAVLKWDRQAKLQSKTKNTGWYISYWTVYKSLNAISSKNSKSKMWIPYTVADSTPLNAILIALKNILFCTAISMPAYWSYLFNAQVWRFSTASQGLKQTYTLHQL